MAPKNPLNKIRSGTVARTMALAKMTVKAGARAASHAVTTVFTGDDGRAERARALLQSQLTLLATELGQLKGSAMKAGQMLSMYGELFLPEEANAILKSLQSQSPPLQWHAIEAVLQQELPADALANLDIDQEPLAAASLGQVHRARRKTDGQLLAVKVQYPGVENAIASDLRALRGILTVSRLLPRNFDQDGIFNEVKQMLEQEADYRQELQFTQKFGSLLQNDARFVVPKPVEDLCSRHVLTTTFETGSAPDSAEVLALPQERRNAIAATLLDLYMRELWQFGLVQTDPHFGNYRVRLGDDNTPDRLVVLDFGAVREVPAEFLRGYRDMVVGACQRDRDQVELGGRTLGFLRDGDEETARNLFVQLCFYICEPFMAIGNVQPEARHLFDETGAYDWGKSDLPKRVTRYAAQGALAFKLRAPPRESVFLDRKLGGVFVFLSVLKAQLRGRDILVRYLPLSP